MNLLVIGSGGREHAICRALRRTSPAPLEIFCAPGNPGIAQVARVVSLAATDIHGLAQFAEERKMDLTIVGGEAPLAAGIVDEFEKRELAIAGASRAAARLESSKVFAKEFMTRHHIPTARYSIADSAGQAREILRRGEFGAEDAPVVVKADGLAGGKGVVVAGSRAEALTAIDDLMVRGSAGPEAARRVVIEEALSGPEASLLLFSDGHDYALMPPARDHKRIGEGDTGPNTGGMGAITDRSVIEDETLRRARREIIEPTLTGAREDGMPFRGVLFVGLMLTADGPRVLEYNVRLGDPEAQAILVRLRSGLAGIFATAARGRGLCELDVEWMDESSACVVLAARGYPGSPEIGARIEGLERAAQHQGVEIFHAGTARSPQGDWLTNGGRVLGVTATAPNLSDALRRCYDSIGEIHWEGLRYRRDIGRF